VAKKYRMSICIWFFNGIPCYGTPVYPG